MLFTPSQRYDAIVDSFLLDSESGADTDISSHCSTPDSVEPTLGECMCLCVRLLMQ